MLLIFFSTTYVYSQNETQNISGLVRDRAGIFIANVSVQVQGSERGTITDARGEFNIQASKFDSLVFSAVGYISTAVIIGDNRVLNIVLEAEQNSMNEVVVVGFGRQRKISVVGAQSTVNPEELDMPVSNINTLLAGRLSGVIGVQRGGQPGRSGADIWIRGISTFGGGSSAPLILVDGVQRSINNIDPQDIASFTVLKDAAGTAVYGVRGANGVILITTKTGKVGKPQVSLDFSQGISTFTQVPKMANASQYLEAANESFTTRGQVAKYSQEYIDNTLNGADSELYPNVDWFDALFKPTGSIRTANVNVNGGTDFLKYYGSVSYYDETGLMNTDKLQDYNADLKFRRFNVTTNVNMNITRTTKLDIGIRGFFSNINQPYIGVTDIFGSAMSTPPTEYPLEYTGGFVPGKNPNGGFRNPWADLTRRGYNTEFTNELFSNLRLTQDFGFLVKGLSATSMFAFDASNRRVLGRGKREDTFFPDPEKPRNDDGSLNLTRTFVGSGNYLSYERSNFGERKFYWESSLNYDNTFGKSRVGGLALFYTQDMSEEFAGDFASAIPQRSVGFAGRLTYSYDDRYFIEGNIGYNGSETFAPENRFGTFPAFGVGWVPSNEKFFQPVKNVITYLKFRYSDGLTGIGDIVGRRFGYLTIVADNVQGYRFAKDYGYTSGINVTEFGYDVRWAEARKQDLGVEIKTLNDRLSLIVDFFKERREGIFLRRGLCPYSWGLVANSFGNLGITTNKGIDGSIEYNGNIGQFTFNLRGNFTYNKDEMVENDQPIPKYPWMDRRGDNILARFGYVAEGLFRDQAEIDASAVPGDKSLILPGDIKYKDLNGDGLINSYDQTKIGFGDVPSMVYGFGFGLGYKAFKLNVLFTGQNGADVFLAGDAIQPFANGAGISNVFSNIEDRWTEANPRQDVFYPRLANGEDRNRNNTQTSTWWLRDADFIRLKTAELDYIVPQHLIKGVFKKAIVYIQAFNPLTFSQFKFWDLESTVNVGNGTRYPNIKSYSLGVNLNF
ncbi:SusC/RagA family TonB-linked outer membrane protein [Niabella ginsengisoli]|uniref:TonB-dependent receptor n=1 Tax=Niabella ginsengisoli TaxID=522298 RepID=A0ABS9SLD3_9BACT|nr:TonB-dependent receptor [Niabella ginsengisoli]MCH5599175.1 TonB-dependent receptor [Niabella ginsengisoli]